MAGLQSTGSSGRIRGRKEAEGALSRLQRLCNRVLGVAAPASAPTISTLIENLLRRYVLEERSILASARSHVKPLLEAFGELTVPELDTELIDGYKVARIAQGRRHKTVNNELSMLRRALRLGQKTHRGGRPLVERPPPIELFPRRLCRPRERFLTLREYEALRVELPVYLVGLLDWLWHTGWRLGECQALLWEHVHLSERVVILPESKNGEARILPITRHVLAVLLRQWERRSSRWVFSRGGKPLRSIYTAWRSAVKRAGIEGVTPHDLRRSWCRRAVNAGVSLPDLMRLGGWRDASVATQYARRSTADLRAAAERIG